VENKTIDAISYTKYGKKDYKIEELKTFLSPFARYEKKEVAVEA